MEFQQDDFIIKICGITSVKDALMIAQAGANWIGLNFWAPSPRSISSERAKEIVDALPSHIQTVGVFVDEQTEEMNRIASECGLDWIQLHGEEPASLLTSLHVPAFKALRVGSEADVEASRDYLATDEDLFLVDARHPTLPGGTGLQVSESVAHMLCPLGRMILAGGLTPKNVGTLITSIRPAGVDTASGVESAPGIKDADLVQEFVREAIGAYDNLKSAD